jgi:tellurite resistance protein
LLSAVRRIAKAPGEGRVARFVLDCGADIIDADGRHSPEEIQWAVELSGALKAAA